MEFIDISDIGLDVFKYELTQLLEFHRRTEAYLERELCEFKSNVDMQVSHIPDEEQRYYYYELQQERYVELVDSFPSLLRQSLLLTAVSALEHHLDVLCRDIAKARNVRLSPNDLADKGISRSRTYMKKVLELPFPDDSAEWARLRFVTAVRNAFAHAGGRCHDEELRKEIERKLHISVNSWGEIRVDAQFVSDAIHDMGMLAQKLDGLLEKDRGGAKDTR